MGTIITQKIDETKKGVPYGKIMVTGTPGVITLHQGEHYIDIHTETLKELYEAIAQAPTGERVSTPSK